MGLANDFSVLGFVPKGANLEDIALALHASFGDETSKTQLDFQVTVSFTKLRLDIRILS